METTQINKALILALAETKDVHADATNPFHKSKYATLSAHLSYVKPIFAKHGLGIIQFPHSNSEGGVGVLTRVVHTSGEYIESTICLPSPFLKSVDKNGNPREESGFTGQQAGAVISYLRRYALACVAGVATDDDDAETDRSVRSEPQEFKPSTNYKANKTAQEVATVQAQTFSVPTDGDIDPSMPVPFGNNKGTPIGQLGFNDLKYWATGWQPRPYEKTGKVTKKDATLKATAVALFSKTQSSSADEEPQDEIPF
jgi:hypothetical protein